MKRSPKSPAASQVRMASSISHSRSLTAFNWPPIRSNRGRRNRYGPEQVQFPADVRPFAVVGDALELDFEDGELVDQFAGGDRTHRRWVEERSDEGPPIKDAAPSVGLRRSAPRPTLHNAAISAKTVGQS